MKRRFLPIALLLAGSLAAANAYAQENTLRVEKKLIERSGDYLLVDLTLNLSDLVVRSNRSVTYTPVIQRGDSLRRLPALIVNGRNRQILYERTGRDIATDGEFAVRRKNGTEQRFDYHARVPYARWMGGPQERPERALPDPPEPDPSAAHGLRGAAGGGEEPGEGG